MTPCTGAGQCFVKCNCYGLYTLPPADLLKGCHCIYSKSKDRSNEKYSFRKLKPCFYNCTLKKCKLYNHCHQKCPQWVLDTHGNQDIHCGMGNTMFDGTEFLNIVEDCIICYNKKYMVQFGCKHKMCFECMWLIYSEQQSRNQMYIIDGQEEKQADVACPLCRKSISVLLVQ